MAVWARQGIVTERDIRDFVGDNSFLRGLAYYRRGAVFDTLRRGGTLLARSRGSGKNEYRIELRLDDAGAVEQAHCTCPVGGDGRCKHVAAVLLKWLHSPDVFRDLEDARRVLRRRTKAELIALVDEFLRREPELQLLIEAPRVHVPPKG
ncbi:MAG TPA: SWIM zinc finger family protein [Planctomycetaceae bacterium]|nr:SWIM zinc finger family protein [Planctomycetaceae bacterium]